MPAYQRPTPSLATTRRRIEGDKAAFEAQAAVHRRLMDLLEDELADARAANFALAVDVLEGEVARQAGLEAEMQASADHAAIQLSALAAKVGACPKTGRSATLCDHPDHINCPDLGR